MKRAVKNKECDNRLKSYFDRRIKNMYPSARIDFRNDFNRAMQLQKEISALEGKLKTLRKEEHEVWKRNDFKFELAK